MTAYPSIDQKVICINDDWHRFSPVVLDGLALPQKWAVYTIIAIKADERGRWLTLAEIPSRQTVKGIGCIYVTWGVAHFKPLDDSKLDIFREALAPSDADVREVVEADKRRFEVV
jgi:hypothetical protein